MSHSTKQQKDGAVVIWGNQLYLDHNSALTAAPDAPIIIIESFNVCRKYRYHKQKLWFVLTAMRDFADQLEKAGRTVWYSHIEDAQQSWFDELEAVCKQHTIGQLTAMRASDRTPQGALQRWCKKQQIELSTTPNELFLTATADFGEWASSQQTLRMENFYRWQRKRLNILMDGDKPVGGKWNYDSENRQPLPAEEQPPTLPKLQASRHARAVHNLVMKYFADHPGTLNELWLPTDSVAAHRWLDCFVYERLEKFGRFEDAMRSDEAFLYHSTLSPLLNIGLIHPLTVVKTIEAQREAPLAAREGFIRQIIGWREFMFGLYHYKPIDWKRSNYLQARKKLPDWWWQLADAPEPPLTDALKRLERYGYNHHIERLMVFGNYMLLSGYDPRQVYDWFMTMYVDAYEWVMVGNVTGMSQYADGGADNGGFATKPYISGSNYLQKMGSWWPSAAAAKRSGWTELYWQFLERNHQKLADNYRLKPLLKRFQDN